MSDKPTRIIIPRAGISTGESTPRAVYDHRSSKIMSALGEVVTQRASNVEPGHALSRKALAVLYKAGYAVRAGFLWLNYQIKDEYHVHWFADMTPSCGNVVLGPYKPWAREEALRDEVEWLQAHNIPACYDCGYQQLFGNKPTGRTSSETPNESNWGKPNFQPVSRDVLPLTGVLDDVDYSQVEARVLAAARRTAGEQLFAGLQWEIEAVNGWIEDGETLRRTYFVAVPAGASRKKVFTIVFDSASVTPVTACDEFAE